MASFTALNIEPDADSEEELDNTKEIQVEEALKLYQTALRFHSQGSSKFEQADAAYDALFKSEIFSYPESQSEATRLASQIEPEDVEVEDLVETGPVLGGLTSSDNASNTLQQLLYLAFKNHGQFLLDRLALDSKRAPLDHQEGIARYRVAERGLRQLAEALDRDVSDVELWRRVSNLAMSLGSTRLSRYSLESAIDVASEEHIYQAGAENLELAVVTEDLEDLTRDLDNEHFPESSNAIDPPRLSKSFKSLLSPMPNIPSIERPDRVPMASPPRRSIILQNRSWSNLFEAIVEESQQEESSRDKSTIYCFAFSDKDDSRSEEVMELVQTPQVMSLVTAESLSKVQTTAAEGSSTEATAGAHQTPNHAGEGCLQTEEPAPTNEDLIKPREPGGADPEIQQEAKSPPSNHSADALKTENETDGLDSPQIPRRTRGDAAALESPKLLKRDSETAGIDEPADGTRSRSKRLRAKAETMDDVLEARDLSKVHEEQSLVCRSADEALMQYILDLASRLKVERLQNRSDFTAFLLDEAGNPFNEDPKSSLAAADLRAALTFWTPNMSNLILNGTGAGASATLVGSSDDAGLSAFLDTADPNRRRAPGVIEELNAQALEVLLESLKPANVVLEDWVVLSMRSILRSSSLHKDGQSISSASLYMASKWPPGSKDNLTRLLCDFDGSIYDSIVEELADADTSRLDHSQRCVMTCEMVQSIFELELDIYSRMTSPKSKIDQPTRMLHRDRLHRWYSLATQAFARVDGEQGRSMPALLLRHVWASVIYVSLVEAASREHVLLCLQGLKDLVSATGHQPIYLPNTSTMSEISPAAAEAEIRKLTTMDFFLGIFNPSSDDPLLVIEHLEPVLFDYAMDTKTLTDTHGIALPQTPRADNTEDDSLDFENKIASTNNHDLSQFLQHSDTGLRLSLWHRLQSAYETIEWPAMVVVCSVHSLDLILAEIQGPAYGKEDAEQQRIPNLLVWIRNLMDISSHMLALLRAHDTAFDGLDDLHLQLALRTMIRVFVLLRQFTSWDDSIRIGSAKAPTQPAGGAHAYKSAMSMLRDLQPKIYMLLYLLFREGMSQDRELFPDASDRSIELLSAMHRSLGNREYCKLGKKGFLRFEKSELLRFDSMDTCEYELAQVLYDLHGLKVLPNNSILEDHGCSADQIDRSTALEIIGFVVAQSRKISTKDLVKSELKAATEKMQAIIGIPRSSNAQQAFNRRVTSAFLKSGLNPLELYRSMKGVGCLATTNVSGEYAAVARKRWFFLLGRIALAKYRSQKHTTPDTSDDLDDAEKFLRLDLDFEAENWETWFRLAQTFDAKLDEDTTWSSDELNDPKSDLVAMQRSAIHCYAMAIAVAVREADGSRDMREKLSELYTEFGTRLYSASRKPFSMQAFGLQDFERFCNGASRTYKREPHRQMTEENVWRYCRQLFRMALVERPDYWWNWYMFGKTSWKLSHRENQPRAGVQQILDAFTKAVELVPEKRDTRHDRDTVLEPHYKLLTIVHKMVLSKALEMPEAIKQLDASSHLQKLETVSDESWNDYALRALKALRAVDKQNWHHRMVMRVAHILYDDTKSLEAAQAAKAELTQQIFTKTMTVQVWKPEYERPGRHFVYTKQYVRFFVTLLHQVGDRASLEALGKKLRKRQGEYVDHVVVWTDICTAHLKLLRSQGNIPENHEDVVFKTSLSHEIFVLNAERLEKWAHSDLATDHPTLQLLQETIELKRLNGNLIRPVAMDDLINDMYARIYEQIVPGLEAQAGDEENRERMRIDRMLMTADTPAAEQSSRATTPSELPTAATRAKNIGRTEVRRRAEALVTKPGSVPAPTRGRPPASANKAQNLLVRATRRTEEDSSAKDTSEGTTPLALQESADDESELSEIEEDIETIEKDDAGTGATESKRETQTPATPLFPGLQRDERRERPTEKTTESTNKSTTENTDGGPAEESETIIDSQPLDRSAAGTDRGDEMSSSEMAGVEISVQEPEAATMSESAA